MGNNREYKKCSIFGIFSYFYMVMGAKNDTFEPKKAKKKNSFSSLTFSTWLADFLFVPLPQNLLKKWLLLFENILKYR